jgi:hypothetical protein
MRVEMNGKEWQWNKAQMKCAEIRRLWWKERKTEGEENSGDLERANEKGRGCLFVQLGERSSRADKRTNARLASVDICIYNISFQPYRRGNDSEIGVLCLACVPRLVGNRLRICCTLKTKMNIQFGNSRQQQLYGKHVGILQPREICVLRRANFSRNPDFCRLSIRTRA